MGIKKLGESRVEKLKSKIFSGPRMKLWMIRAMTSVLWWTCLVQFTALREIWGPRILKGWPSCTSHGSASAARVRVLPPKSELLYASIHLFSLVINLVSVVTSDRRNII